MKTVLHATATAGAHANTQPCRCRLANCALPPLAVRWASALTSPPARQPIARNAAAKNFLHLELPAYQARCHVRSAGKFRPWPFGDSLAATLAANRRAHHLARRGPTSARPRRAATLSAATLGICAPTMPDPTRRAPPDVVPPSVASVVCPVVPCQKNPPGTLMLVDSSAAMSF